MRPKLKAKKYEEKKARKAEKRAVKKQKRAADLQKLQNRIRRRNMSK